MSTFATESKSNRFRSCSSKTGLIYLDLVVALREGYPECFFLSSAFYYPLNPRIDMNKNEKKRKELSYYHLYLQKHLQENRFEQAGDASFIETRADLAATAYEQARREGYPIEGAQELAMQTLLKGFKSKQGKSFDAIIAFDADFNTVFVFPEVKNKGKHSPKRK